MRGSRLSFLSLLLPAVLLLGPAVPGKDFLSPWKNPVRRIVLDNGLTLLHQQDGSSAVTSLCILIKGGKRSEPEGLAGIAYLSTRLMLEMPDFRSARRLMLQASPLSLSCQGDFCLIEVESLSAHFEETLKILARPLQGPLFTDIRIEALKRYMGYLRQRETEEAASLGRAMHLRAVFGPTGYGASAYGTDSSVKEVRGRDLARHYETLFRSGNVLLSVVTDRGAEDMASLLGRCFKDIRRGGPVELRPFTLSDRSGTSLSAEKDTLQSFVASAYLLPGASPRTYALAALAESLLGKGVASRLWKLRQEEQLAYSFSCNFLPMKDAGVLEARLETENEKLDAAREAFHRVLGEVSAGGVDAEELRAAGQIALTDFLRDNEAKNTRARNMAFYEALGLGYDFLEKIPALFESVTVEDMNAFLGEWLNPDRAVKIVIAGTRRKNSLPVP